MKKLLVVLALFSTLFAEAQTIVGDRVIARKRFALNEYWIDTIRNDVNFQGSVLSVPTADAVYRYVRLFNLGDGYRISLIGSHRDIRTLYPGYGITIDSTSNANTLTFTADTATLFTIVRTTITTDSIKAQNGLSKQDIRTVELGSPIYGGSPLLRHTYINTANYKLIVGGFDVTRTLEVNNTATGDAVYANATSGRGTYTRSNSGFGLFATSISNIAGYFFAPGGRAVVADSYGFEAVLAQAFYTTNNDVQTAMTVARLNNTGSAGVDGSGVRLVLAATNSQGASIVSPSNEFVSKWTTANFLTRVSEFSITGHDNGVKQTLFTLGGNGLLTLNKYTGTTFRSVDTTLFKPLMASTADGVVKTGYWPVGLGGGGAPETLQETFDTEVGGSILTKNDTILANAYTLKTFGTAVTVMEIKNTTNNTGVYSRSTGSGIGVWGESALNGGVGVVGQTLAGANSAGIKGVATEGIGIYGITNASGGLPGLFSGATPAVGGTTPIISLTRSALGGTPIDGIGGYLSYSAEYIGSTTDEMSRISSKWTTVANRTSDVEIYTKNVNTLTRKLSIGGNGQLYFDSYIGTAFRVVDTTLYKPVVAATADGRIMTSYWAGTGVGGGGGGSNNIYNLDSSLTGNRTVDLNSFYLRAVQSATEQFIIDGVDGRYYMGQQLSDIYSHLNMDDYITVLNAGNNILESSVKLRLDADLVAASLSVNNAIGYSFTTAGGNAAVIGDYANTANSTKITLDDNTEKITFRSDSLYITATAATASVGHVWTLLNPGTGSGYWAAGGATGVTSVATGYGLSGGTITSTGTILADTATLFTALRNNLIAQNGLSKTAPNTFELGGTGLHNTNIDWSNYKFSQTWNTLSGTGLELTSNSADASGNASKLLSILTYGANSNAAQSTYGIYVTNSHTGTGAINYGIYGIASAAGTTNYGGFYTATNGATNIGVAGSGNTVGVQGTSAGGSGVAGYATSGGGQGVYGNGTGNITGVNGTSGSGWGVRGYSSTGIGIYAQVGNSPTALSIMASPIGTTDVTPTFIIKRAGNFTAADGFGESIDFELEHNNPNGSTVFNRIKSIATTVDFPTMSSTMTISGFSGGVENNVISLIGSGRINLPKYGVNTFAGTAAYALGVEADGDIVEIAAGGSGTVTSVATGYGLSGGTITTSGTLVADSATLFTAMRNSLFARNGLSKSDNKTIVLGGEMDYGLTTVGHPTAAEYDKTVNFTIQNEYSAKNIGQQSALNFGDNTKGGYSRFYTAAQRYQNDSLQHNIDWALRNRAKSNNNKYMDITDRAFIGLDTFHNISSSLGVYRSIYVDYNNENWAYLNMSVDSSKADFLLQRGFGSNWISMKLPNNVTGANDRWMVASVNGNYADNTGNVTLPLFTSTDPGLAPLSGGGTTNFLRADGTWAAPSGTIPGIDDVLAVSQALTAPRIISADSYSLSIESDFSDFTFAASGPNWWYSNYDATHYSGLLLNNNGVSQSGNSARLMSYFAGTTNSLYIYPTYADFVNKLIKTNSGADTVAMLSDVRAGGSGATDLGYTASTRILTSSTGTDVTLPLFTSTDAGLAPLSGGGTTNFLRADGTWAVPAGGGDMVLASTQTVSGAKTFLNGTMLLRNVANTFNGVFTNTNTADRTYTLKDASGTLAFVSDITGTNSGTNTGDQTTIVGITGTKAQFNTAVTDGDFLFVGDITQYTDEQAQDAVGLMINASLQYVDVTPLLAINDRDYGSVTVTGSGLTWTIDAGAVANTMLANSAITINGTSVSLGGTRTLTLASADFVNQGTTTTVLHGNAAGNPSWGAISLTADVSGDLPLSSLAQFTANTVATNATTGTADLSSTTLGANTLLGRGSTGNIAAITVGGILSFSGPVLSATEVDGSVSNELQTFANTSAATTHTVTLSSTGGSVQFVEGGILTMTTTGTAADGIVTFSAVEVDGSVSNELQTLAVTGTTTGITTLSNSGLSMTIAGAGINTVGVAGSTITITGTEVDGSVSNEIQDISITGTSTATFDLSGDATDASITGAGISVVSVVGNAITVTSTEVDGSTSNELQTITNSSGAGTHTITLSNTGGTTQFIAGTNVTFTTGGTGAAGTLTIAASGGTTDLSYTASTRLLASSTGADVTLPLFTSTDAGLTPLSGGGTANFLRADGTWATPGGGGDMVLASVQTNSGAKTFLDATLLMRNVANTFSSQFTNTNTAARTYTLPDRALTIDNITTATTTTGTGFLKGNGSVISFDNSTYLTSVGTGVANELTYWSGTNTLGSLATATYPSLTEMTYVKGVTSSIQTQLNAKGVGDMVLASTQTNSGAKTFLATTLLMRNVANTFNGSFTNTNTADRVYTLKDAAGTIAFVSDITGTNSGTNTGDVTLSGTPDYITISGQVITRGLIDLATDITGRLPYANLVQGAANTVVTNPTTGVADFTTTALSASNLLGRGSTGNIAAITVGGLLSFTGSVLNATLTATNGLNMATGTNVQLGGSLLAATDLTTGGAYGLSVSATTGHSGAVFSVNNNVGATGTGIVVTTDATNEGISVTSLTGRSISVQSTDGNGAYIVSLNSVPILASAQPITTNTVVPVLQLFRSVTSGNGATGLGASIDFRLETTTTGSQVSSAIISKWSDGTHASRTAQMIFQGVNNAGAIADLLTLNGNKSITANGYGVNTFAGTATYALGVEADGDIVEIAIGGGSPTNLTFVASTRLLESSTGTDVTLPLFTSTEAGLVPLSGGGTTNFLRADGTWAAAGGGVDDGDKGDIIVSAGGTTWLYEFRRKVIYSNQTNTDADISAAGGIAYHLPAATLTVNRNINMTAVSQDGDLVEFYNNETGFVFTFTGQTVYDSDGTTVVTELLANANSVVRRMNGKLMISKL